MWKPRRLTTLWVFTARYRDNFTIFYKDNWRLLANPGAGRSNITYNWTCSTLSAHNVPIFSLKALTIFMRREICILIILILLPFEGLEESPVPKITDFELFHFFSLCLFLSPPLCFSLFQFYFFQCPFSFFLMSFFSFAFFFYLFHLPRESFSDSDCNQSKKSGCNTSFNLARWFSFDTPVSQSMGPMFMAKMFFSSCFT
jgi:hypothetical protein